MIHNTGVILKLLTLTGIVIIITHRGLIPRLHPNLGLGMRLQDSTVNTTLQHCRFTPEERAKRPQLAHMPFGFGPRSCVAMRFALLEIKIAIMELLKKYSFVRIPETEVSL